MFFTKLDIPKSSFEISHSDRILTLGSCFAENIGVKLQNAYFLSFINPFGVLYNPISVAKGIRTLLSDKEFTASDLIQSGSLWSSFSHSSLFSATSAEESLQKINSRLIAARNFLSATNVLMITFGTAWIFEYIKTGNIVANCHKIAANQFNRRRLSVEEIVSEFSEIIELLNKKNPNLKIIFTVSPIRHWKDGAHENTVSKSTLHLAVDQLEKKYNSVNYFPAFEIMIDELRDYRFYDSDMLHPSKQAVDYIWSKFSQTYFSDETNQLKKELQRLRADLNHRPLHIDTIEYQQFLEAVDKKKNRLIEKYSFLRGRIE
ncbi:MAG: GSCFA domain-containing protein [Porphyromonadaceae bacterium]|nr:GSCFA domain-containing protein [Porphyromonadaceae bacterium]